MFVMGEMLSRSERMSAVFFPNLSSLRFLLPFSAFSRPLCLFHDHVLSPSEHEHETSLPDTLTVSIRFLSFRSVTKKEVAG
jgi:hypothetical protein